MRPAWLAALVVVTAACGAYSFPGEHPSPSSATGAVSGRVIAVPCKPVPVLQADAVCAGRPVASLEIDYAAASGSVSRTVTDTGGNYAIRLAAGTYGVKMKTYMRVISGPLRLDVQAGSTTVANYVLDSGIRVPPQPVPAPLPQQ